MSGWVDGRMGEWFKSSVNISCCRVNGSRPYAYSMSQCSVFMSLNVKDTRLQSLQSLSFGKEAPQAFVTTVLTTVPTTSLYHTVSTTVSTTVPPGPD